MRAIAMMLLILLVVACSNSTAPETPNYTMTHAFVADTGNFCQLRWQITTTARGGASLSILFDSIGINPSAATIPFYRDTVIDFRPARPSPYWVFWDLYFPTPGTAVIVNVLDSAYVLAPPAC